MKPPTGRCVALNGRFSGTLQPTGTQVASFQLFDAIIRSERDFPVVVFADSRFPGVEAWSSVPNTKVLDIPFSRWRRSVAQLWEQLFLPAAARRRGCGLIHHPMTTCSRWRAGLRHIVTVHDLNFYHHPEWVSRAFHFWLSAVALPAIKRADQVVAISDYVLNDLRRTLGIPEKISSRIYNGLNPLPVGPDARSPQTVKRVILGVNLWQPHKNLIRLLHAFAMLRTDDPTLELHLVGRPQAHFRSQSGLAGMLSQPGVRVLGYLTEHKLGRAYASANVVCFPSLEEGFGLPVLEAMAAGTPVVTSNVSCLPEIAGGAAILVDPYSADSIACGIRDALEEPAAARLQRVVNGRRVASEFSWASSATKYIQLYRTLL